VADVGVILDLTYSNFLSSSLPNAFFPGLECPKIYGGFRTQLKEITALLRPLLYSGEGCGNERGKLREKRREEGRTGDGRFGRNGEQLKLDRRLCMYLNALCPTK